MVYMQLAFKHKVIHVLLFGEVRTFPQALFIYNEQFAQLVEGEFLGSRVAILQGALIKDEDCDASCQVSCTY